MVRRVHHLVGVAEIRAMLQVSRQRVDALTRGEDFPPPVADLQGGRIWRRADVERWAAAQDPPRAVVPWDPAADDRPRRPSPRRRRAAPAEPTPREDTPDA